MAKKHRSTHLKQQPLCIPGGLGFKDPWGYHILEFSNSSIKMSQDWTVTSGDFTLCLSYLTHLIQSEFCKCCLGDSGKNNVWACSMQTLSQQPCRAKYNMSPMRWHLTPVMIGSGLTLKVQHDQVQRVKQKQRWVNFCLSKPHGHRIKPTAIGPHTK